MAIKILEKFILGKKNNPDLCEDGLVIINNYISIIDGVTSKGNILWNNKPSGVYAKEILTEAIKNMSDNLTAEEAINYLNLEIEKEYEKHNIYEYVKENPEERIQANLVIFSIKRNEIWAFGDCQMLINNKYFHEEKKIDKILSDVRSLFVDLELKNGKTIEELRREDSGREYILPLLKQSIKYNNSIGEYGYNVLDGFKIITERVTKISVNKKDIVILASDGYPILMNTLKESEEKLEEILNKDPLLVNMYKSTKGLQEGNVSYDDRAYIKFIIE
jgi:hypothetical protein